jgi:hypothetical protein
MYIDIDMQAQIEEVLCVWPAYPYKLASPEPSKSLKRALKEP